MAELGAGLAHELNNPLAAVLGLAQVLRSRHREGNPGEDALLDDLEAQAGRCREVVATMLRVQTLEVDPTDVPVVQLTDVLHQVRGLVGGPFRQRGVQLDVTEPDPELRVRIDPVHGSRILAQILNALRAGLEPGSAVTIDAERDGDNVLVRLIPDRPVAAHPDRRDDWLASGHGLWVARQLLARLGGRLDVDPHDTVGGPVWGVTLPGA
ncbi:MAG: HAMP domain-containing sensor histidine kinase [Myxococcota bacterium]